MKDATFISLLWIENDFKWIRNYNVRPEMLKLLEEKMGENSICKHSQRCSENNLKVHPRYNQELTSGIT